MPSSQTPVDAVETHKRQNREPHPVKFFMCISTVVPYAGNLNSERNYMNYISEMHPLDFLHQLKQSWPSAVLHWWSAVSATEAEFEKWAS